jgi:uncharacterized protein YggU (UPF0235/DUF167 family)
MARRKLALPSAAMILAFADEQGRLPIRVTPNASADAVGLPAPGAAPVLLIRTTAAPENGRANEIAIALLAKALDRSPSALTLVRGHASRDKLIRINLEDGR